MSRKPTISVCMIAKNEEHTLLRVLSSIQGLADEVIFVDTGSADKTVEIAQSFGAKVYHFPWCDDFSGPRNESLRYATKDYILWLDADDEVKQEEHAKIWKSIEDHKNGGLFLRLKNVQENNISESLQLRIFPNHRGIKFEGRVHEQTLYSIQRKRISTFPSDAVILHYGYEKLDHVEEKLKRNLRILEAELREKSDSLNTLFFLGKTLKGLGELESAVAYYDRMLSLGKNDPKLYSFDVIKMGITEKATILYSLGKKQETKRTLEEGKALYPNYAPLLFSLGEFYYLDKEYDLAFKELLPLKNENFKNEVIPMNIPETQRCLREYLGMSALFVGEYEVASHCFQAAIKHDPLNEPNYHYLSLAKEKSGDVDGAITVCREGLDKLSRDDYLHKRLFLLYAEKRDFEKALGIFEKLNGFRGNIDVIAGMFLINCCKLDADGINKYYGLIQKQLSMEPQVFPGRVEETRQSLNNVKEDKTISFFNRGISFLLNQNT